MRKKCFLEKSVKEEKFQRKSSKIKEKKCDRRSQEEKCYCGKLVKEEKFQQKISKIKEKKM